MRSLSVYDQQYQHTQSVSYRLACYNTAVWKLQICKTSHKGCRSSLISVSLGLSQTPAYTARLQIWC